MLRKSSCLAWASLLVLLGASGYAFSQSRPRGGVTGFVLDEAGNPVIGAIIRLLPVDSPAQPVKTLRTGMDGKYVAKNLAPGAYRLRAEARGFLPVAHIVEIKPQLVLSLDMELRRTGTLAEQREDREDYRWAVRASRRHVLRFNRNGEVAETFQVPIPQGQWRGHIQWVSGTLTAGRTRARWGSTMTFALVQEFSPHGSWAWAGQVNPLGGYPGRWEMELSAKPETAHHLTAAVALTRWERDPETPNASDLQSLTLRVADHWMSTAHLLVTYGVDLQRTHFRGRTFWEVSPRLGLRWAATERMRIKAAFLPWSLAEAQTDLTPGSPRLLAPYPIRLRLHPNGQATDGGRQWQIGVERALGEHQKIELALFTQSEGAPIDPKGQRLSRKAQSRHGLRVLYTRSLGNSLQATIGYAAGQGEIPEGGFHVLAGRLDAAIVRTRTRLTVHFRTATNAGDPFYTTPPDVLSVLIAPVGERSWDQDFSTLPLLDPGVTLVIAQELPTLAFLPGRWEAILEARNVIAWPHCASGDSLLLVRAPLLIRGSLALRF